MTTTDELLRALLYLQSTNKATLEHTLDLMGRQASWQVRQQKTIGSLRDVEFQVYSQWGEDGIIDWLTERVPVRSERFIEFGVEHYRESNTRFLLKRRNWQGLVIDGSPEYVQAIKGDDISWRHDLTSVAHFITRENINALFERAGFTGPIGLLSVDLDGMDYWVWERITVVDPDIVVCEYNSAFGDLHPITIPYNADFQRFKAHHSGCYFGASIAALVHLARAKGYTLVGTNSAGCNAFFVHDRHAAQIGALIADTRPVMARYRESRNADGHLDHRRPIDVVADLARLPVQRVDTLQVLKLGELGTLFSTAWSSEIAAPIDPPGA